MAKKKSQEQSLEQLRKSLKQQRDDYKEAIKNWPPFPLPDIYDSDDPNLINATLRGVQRLRMNYREDVLPFFSEQYIKVIDVCLMIRSAWAIGLTEVPIENNTKYPTKGDFLKLEDWLITTFQKVQEDIKN